MPQTTSETNESDLGLVGRVRQVLQHRPGRARQLAPGPVPPVKRQVDGAEEVGEAFGPRLCIGHGTRVAPGRSIVNPDG